jgi:hypothetical protein
MSAIMLGDNYNATAGQRYVAIAERSGNMAHIVIPK